MINAQISPGGEITKRRAFVQVASVPNTFGLAATESRLLVFGRNVDPSVPALGVPGVTLDGLKVPNAAADLKLMDYDIFDGKLYIACSQPSGADVATKNPHYFEDPLTTMTLTEGAG